VAHGEELNEIIAACGRAMGGPDGVESLHSLSFRETGHGPGRDLLWEIRRPNLVRKERPGELVLVFDGMRAAFLEGPPLDSGALDQPHVVPAEHWHHFEMDIALYIPAFFDYPARYGGLTRVDGAAAHVIEVTLPMGGEVIYRVDAESSLPLTVALPAWSLERVFGDWREVDGSQVPGAYWSPSDPDSVTRMVDIAVNRELPEGRFAIPDGLEIR
jgi:hypothetical protein